MAHINGSGVQQHSAGVAFPFVVFKREQWENGAMIDARYVVTLAGEMLATRATGAEADALALLFKQHNVRNIFDAQWAEAQSVMADQDAERFAISRREGDKRMRNDYLEMYGDPDYVPLNEHEVEAWRLADRERIDARDALERAAEAGDRTDVTALDLARRALGLIA